MVLRLHQHSVGYTGDGFLQVKKTQSTEGTHRVHK